MRWWAMVAFGLCAGCAGLGDQVPLGSEGLGRLDVVASEDESFPVSVPSAFGSLRGYLVVPEDPWSDSGREIKLPVVVVKAKDPAPGLPPVLRLAGGPGLSGLSAAAYPGAYPWTANRDFIILGQRGTQGASPELICSEYYDALGADRSQQISAAQLCRDRYTAQEIALSAYHSAASARDIEALRQALGAEQLSLYGGSYGTRLALTYARDYPDHVASMVLDSVLPHDVSYDDESPRNLRDALNAVGEACAADPGCAADFPDVFERFMAALDQARSEPWQVDLPTGEVVSLTDSDLALLVNIGSSAGVASAPKVMDAIARRDAEVATSLIGQEGRRTPFAWGMRLSFWCSEDAPFGPEADDARVPRFASLNGTVVPPEVCAVWDVPQRPLAEKQPTTASIPTLIIAGALDPVTPPRWAKQAAGTLSRSHVVIVPYGRHVETNNWSGDGCAMAIADTFFSDEQAFLSDSSGATACLSERQGPNFQRR